MRIGVELLFRDRFNHFFIRKCQIRRPGTGILAGLESPLQACSSLEGGLRSLLRGYNIPAFLVRGDSLCRNCWPKPACFCPGEGFILRGRTSLSPRSQAVLVDVPNRSVTPRCVLVPSPVVHAGTGTHREAGRPVYTPMEAGWAYQGGVPRVHTRLFDYWPTVKREGPLGRPV